MPLKCGRRRSGIVPGRVDTAVPGVQKAPGPSRVSYVRYPETPSGSGPASGWPGKPTVRKAQFPGAERDAQEANAGG